MTSYEMASVLRRAELTRTAQKPFSESQSLTLAEGYAVQSAGLALRQEAGEILCGYKMGLTSRAKQRDVNVFEPIRGYLLRSYEVLRGEPVRTGGRIHPRVEPEVALIFKDPVGGKYASVREVVSSLASVVPACEIIDSRYEAFSFKLGDVVADNTSASGFMLGSWELKGALNEVPLLGVTMKKNGQLVETGAPAAVLGDPLISAVQAVRMLAEEGKRIEAGMVLLTGGITAAVPFQAGDWIEMIWPGESLSFRAV